ncbi:MAG: hypothetical protein V3U84_09205 [Thiotrichaceae bacterium]
MIKKILLPLSVSLLAMTLATSNAAPKVPSASEIKAQQEKKYATEMVRMKKKDASKDAEAAKRLGFPYLLAHHAGRSASLVIPGLAQKDYKTAQARCPILILDGLGDTIYGDQHMAYRKAATDYAAQFNQITYKACMR